MQSYRDSVDQVFADPERSILPEADLEHFDGLHYFEIDEKWRVKARFKRVYFRRSFKMKTSTDRLPVYKPYGKFIFSVDGVQYELRVYRNMDKEIQKRYGMYLFMPFTDLTNNESTYGGGRYLDFKPEDLAAGYIDFNRCYNPYCAYNSRYSCPVPPLENHLELAVEAGVKKWHD
ncbi:MAG: DUF1684 domain-containing protein [Flavobacteriales bacterium]|nr:DUF1684 domain-containing protein [Flavobacteriales bacterium]